MLLLCVIPREKKFGIFELVLAQMMAAGAAHWQLPFPFLCSLPFHSGAALLFTPTTFETIKQTVFKHVIFLLLR
jgi:hypothetical protein